MAILTLGKSIGQHNNTWSPLPKDGAGGRSGACLGEVSLMITWSGVRHGGGDRGNDSLVLGLEVLN